MAKYNLIVQRVQEFKTVKKPNVERIEGSTISDVKLINTETNETIFSCYCCENIGPSTDTSKQDKRIVARNYKLSWTDSGKNASLARTYPEYKKPNGRNTAILLSCDELPTFASRRILIHVGNYPQDTEGCLLFGTVKGKGTVSNSIACIYKFFKKVEEIGIENITLTIKEIPVVETEK